MLLEHGCVAHVQAKHVQACGNEQTDMAECHLQHSAGMRAIVVGKVVLSLITIFDADQVLCKAFLRQLQVCRQASPLQIQEPIEKNRQQEPSERDLCIS